MTNATHSPSATSDIITPAGRTLSAQLAQTIAPQRPYDDDPFDKLAQQYNFLLTSDRRRVFSRLVIKECERVRRESAGPVRVLDIGCGRGIGRQTVYTEAMRAYIDEFWGIEPDDQVTPREGLFDHFQHALMETATLPESYFDVIYSFMVMEHVAEPEKFLAASARCLKPGGVHIFMTPNAGHYFTISASLMHKLKIDELVLRLLKRGEEESYHYPVQYKCNSPRQITAAATRAGYSTCQYAFLESEGPTGYMKGPLVLAYHALRFKRKIIKSQKCLLTLTARLTRA
ncbi:MAG: class I SAM-dependent methyltransferase [Phycisphaeraceae bacterium]|nr:class I SAM-dependent methyltransferase [Phycisphaeraceae bacterium]MCW5764298.1 class I SAM-dependent methyltransferase [Phycisphaeraceae bacterium]